MEPNEILFADETDTALEQPILPEENWKVIIADDEHEIHRVTKLVLSDFKFEGKGLQFISVYNGEEAIQAVAEHSDTALILLDVVMEEEDSGLTVVRRIREQFRNQAIRIVLRTGQPGQSPERNVILDYDINDYKEKTELTAQRLFITVVSALRAYRDIQVIHQNKLGLEKIIASSATMFGIRNLKPFAIDVLSKLTELLNGKDQVQQPCTNSGFVATLGDEGIQLVAGTGSYSQTEFSTIPELIFHEVKETFKQKNSRYDNHKFYGYFQNNQGADTVIYWENASKLGEWERYLIDVYCAIVSVAIENIYLTEELEETRKEIIFTLGEVAETRSLETGYHVKRVSEYSKVLALGYGLSEDETEMIRMASPMHDLGKLGIPDAILNKPGKLTTEEFDVIKTHSRIGFEMLKHAKGGVLNIGAMIALQHHEKYDGTGYPQGLKGEDIHLYARITALADTFDALCSDRVYKKAWELGDILALFEQQRGAHFDPVLVDIFMQNLDEIIRIRNTYLDQKVF